MSNDTKAADTSVVKDTITGLPTISIGELDERTAQEKAIDLANLALIADRLKKRGVVSLTADYLTNFIESGETYDIHTDDVWTTTAQATKWFTSANNYLRNNRLTDTIKIRADKDSPMQFYVLNYGVMSAEERALFV